MISLLTYTAVIGNYGNLEEGDISVAESLDGRARISESTLP
jgi:hypothetical protein